jgi:hypothetical protein
MAVDPSVRIDIAAEFTGKKAFKQADTSTQKLTKSVKSLASGLGLAFSTRAIVNFAKQSVKAFAEDDAAITVLRQNLKNLGLSYESANAENFIGNLEKQTAIFDDELRPAYSKLAKITLSAAKTQELMALAVDLARSNSLPFSDVINTLSRAYVGNYKGLKALNIGLTDAELKTKNFAEIQAILIKQSKGAGKAYIDTFAGSIDKLSVASANAKEIIGEGLVDLFKDIAGNGDIDKATENVISLATAVSDLLKDLDKLTLLDYFGVFLTGSITQETFDKLNVKPGGGFTDSQNAARLAAEKQARLTAAAAAAKLAADKKIAAATAAAKIAADKKAAANASKLAKAQSIFNMEQIQIEAALKGKISENERLRLELQRAILNDDFDLAEKLQKQLEASQRAIGALQGQLQSIKPAANPFDLWIKSLEQIQLSLEKLYKTDGGKIVPFVGKDTTNMSTDELVAYTQETADAATLAAIEAEKTAAYAETFAKLMASGSSTFAGLASAVDTKYNYNFGDMSDVIPTGGQTAFSSGSSVTVNVQGSVLDGNDFVDIVNNALLNSQRQGRSQVAAGALP